MKIKAALKTQKVVLVQRCLLFSGKGCFQFFDHNKIADDKNNIGSGPGQYLCEEDADLADECREKESAAGSHNELGDTG